MNKFIHLLYVPTKNCNMQCSYCYLGDSTRDGDCDRSPLETLDYAVRKFKECEIIPFNISLHGGEVTTLSKEDFASLVRYIRDYYEENRTLITENGFKVGNPHIKTNLFGIDRHLDAIREYNVSISGSLDLPLSLHREYRLTKGGGDTLPKILENIALLESLPNRKKVSATIFREHFLRMDEMIRDIKFLHESTCLDMNDFNFMIGFASSNIHPSCRPLTPLSEDEQVELFRRMNEEFENTDLKKGLDGAWFAEFTQAYCTNCDLCSEKFFLLERNGDVYSCVRGQGDRDFYYGNVYEDTPEEIMNRARLKIYNVHNLTPLPEECAECGYLHLCKTGCPFVKKEYGSGKSYTCRLQKEIYKKNGEAEEREAYPFEYLRRVHPQLCKDHLPKANAPENSLEDLISRDEKLQRVYDPDAFILVCDGNEYRLESQLTKSLRDFIFIGNHSKITLYTRKDVIDALSDYPVNNALYMMLLSGDTVVYGDEGREKQEHIMTHLIYKSTLARRESDREGYYRTDLTKILRPYLPHLSRERENNLFFTTSALRDYHYTKQKNNGYYHIAAMDLPFQNIEFYYIDTEESGHELQ